MLSAFDVSGRTVLVTGGGCGIGLELVGEFIKFGAKTVIITGRREEVLKSAQKQFPKETIEYFVSDVGNTSDRIELFEKVSKAHPDLSVLVNNAGIARRVPLAEDHADWQEDQNEININLCGPIHLSKLFTPLLLHQEKGAAILHVTSGLAFVPGAHAAVYSATKAALHSFLLSQRISFEGTGVRICEIVPPPTKTNIQNYGEDPKEFADNVFVRFLKGEQEVGYKLSEFFRTRERGEIMESAHEIAKVMHLPRYKTV